MSTRTTIEAPTAQVATDGLAIAALVCGICGFLGLTGLAVSSTAWPFVLLAIPAIALGILGRGRLFKSDPSPRGNWMATVGVVLGLTTFAVVTAVMPLSVSTPESPAPVVTECTVAGCETLAS